MSELWVEQSVSFIVLYGKPEFDSPAINEARNHNCVSAKGDCVKIVHLWISDDMRDSKKQKFFTSHLHVP